MNDARRGAVVAQPGVALTGRLLFTRVMQRIQQSFILKGITMTGAALLITQLGVGGTRGD